MLKNLDSKLLAKVNKQINSDEGKEITKSADFGHVEKILIDYFCIDNE